MVINGIPFICIALAAVQYHVPTPMIISVLKVENGKVGEAHKNKNGTFDYGPMQINSIWLKKIKAFGYTAYDLQYNACANVNVGTWILARKIASNKSLWWGVGDYHSHKYRQNLEYQYKVNVFYNALKKTLASQ